jgi:hypothetical protein
MLDIVATTDDKNIYNFYSILSDAVEHYGYAEMHFRQQERSNIAKRMVAGLKDVERIAQRYNGKGEAVLNHALNTLKILKTIPATEVDKKVKDTNKLTEFQEDFLEIMVQIEMKPSDVEKIRVQIEQAVQVVRANGERGILDHLDKKTVELRDTRKSKDRGAVDNIPVWKIAAIAVFLAVGVWLIYRCLVKGKNCDAVERLAKGLGKTIATLIISLC